MVDNDDYSFINFIKNYKYSKEKNLYFLFDVDDTLTKPKHLIDEDMIMLLVKLSKYFTISVVGGGTYKHISSQISPILHLAEFIFSENGTVVYKNNQLIFKKSINVEIGEEILNDLISFLLLTMSKIDIPFKRGTFIEYRNGLLNISPVGKNCTLDERQEFHQYDLKHNILIKFKEQIEEYFKDKSLSSLLSVCFGGKISLDIFPKEWNKSYCLSNLNYNDYKIIFIGDKIFKGGNDYEVAVDKRVFLYHPVKSPEDTKVILDKVISSCDEKYI